MIEAIETHETQVIKPIKIKLLHPIHDGVLFGIGLIMAPILLMMLFLFIAALFGITLISVF